MEALLNSVEVRVLGALIEKEITTPEYYPLTLNSLTTACNQKSNRDPVVSLEEKAVVRALESLRDKGLARQVSGVDMRVPKHYHLFDEKMGLTRPQVAALCVLMLRGPQTVGEIRGRGGRLYEFAGLEEVECVLVELAERTEGALVVQLARQPGRKESRYAHVLMGEPEEEDAQTEGPVDAAALEVRAENERIAALEEQVKALRDELADVRSAFAQFKEQFE
ncbi:MAG: YceH family protein [Candidatus Latescibacterota bacterium]|nr:YceH family protein [Candidatus Latescibacterota bacterium]MEE2729031.1 YceH family protein [Candidatus Latescibacterota bacterium]